MGGAIIFYSFHPCPSLDEKRLLGSMMDYTVEPGISLSMRPATQSELSPKFMIVGDL